MTTTEFNDILGTFVVKSRVLNTRNYFKNKQLPLNENENNLKKI